MRKLWIILPLLLVLLSGCYQWAESDQAQQHLREGLEERYGREFSVGEPQRGHGTSGPFGSSWYEAEAVDLTTGVHFTVCCKADATGLWDDYAQVMHGDAVEAWMKRTIAAQESLRLYHLAVTWSRTPAQWHPDMPLEEFLPQAKLYVFAKIYILDPQQAPAALDQLQHQLYSEGNSIHLHLDLEGYSASSSLAFPAELSEIQARVQELMAGAELEDTVRPLVKEFCTNHPQLTLMNISILCRKEDEPRVTVQLLMEQEKPTELTEQIMELCQELSQWDSILKLRNTNADGGKRNVQLIAENWQTEEALAEKLALLEFKEKDK